MEEMKDKIEKNGQESTGQTPNPLKENPSESTPLGEVRPPTFKVRPREEAESQSVAGTFLKGLLSRRLLKAYESGKELGSRLSQKIRRSKSGNLPVIDSESRSNPKDIQSRHSIAGGKEKVKCKKETIVTTKTEFEKHHKSQKRMNEKRMKVAVRQQTSKKKETKMKL